MASMQINLPDELKAFLDEEAAESGLPVSELIAALVLRERTRSRAQRKYQDLVDQTIAERGTINDGDHARIEKVVLDELLEPLRRELDVGIAQADRGEFVEFDAEDIMREGRARLARKKGKTGGEAA